MSKSILKTIQEQFQHSKLNLQNMRTKDSKKFKNIAESRKSFDDLKAIVNSASKQHQRKIVNSFIQCTQYLGNACQMIQKTQTITPDQQISLQFQDIEPIKPFNNYNTTAILRRKNRPQRKENTFIRKKTFYKNQRMSYDLCTNKTKIKQQIQFPSQKNFVHDKKFYPVPNLEKDEEVVEICRMIKDSKYYRRVQKQEEQAQFKGQQKKKILSFFEEGKKEKFLAFNYDGSILKMRQIPRNSELQIVNIICSQNIEQKIQSMKKVIGPKEIILPHKVNQNPIISQLYSQDVKKIEETFSPYFSNFNNIKWHDKVLQVSEITSNIQNQYQTRLKQNYLEQSQKPQTSKNTDNKRRKSLKFRSFSQNLAYYQQKKKCKFSKSCMNTAKITNEEAYKENILIGTNIKHENKIPLKKTTRKISFAPMKFQKNQNKNKSNLRKTTISRL